jgi:hypothetical protein
MPNTNHPLREHWREVYNSLARQGYKASACRKEDGYCLDVSDAWEGVQAGMKTELLGFRYLEFIHPQFLAPFLEWVTHDERGPFSYPTIMLRPDNRVPMILSQTKHLVGDINILIGATEIIVNPAVLKKFHYDSRTRAFGPG